MITVLFIFKLSAQDTLRFKTGETKIVKVLAIDTVFNLITYIADNDTLLVTESAILNHSNFTNDVIVRSTDALNNTSVYYANLLEKKASNKLGKYQYAPWSIGIGTNMLTLLYSDIYPINLTSNPSMDIFAEYFFNKHIGIRIPMRLGFKIKKDYDKLILNDFNDYHKSSYYSNYHASIFEVGIEPLFFIDNRRKNSFYIAPSFNFGVNQYYKAHFYETILEGSNYSTSFLKDFELSQDNYYPLGLLLGFRANYLKRFTFGTEFGLAISNISRSYVVYHNLLEENGEYYVRFERPGNQADIYVKLNFNLIYRFGGQLKTSKAYQ